MTTLRILAEQILRLHYGGNIPDDAELDIREVYRLIGQAASEVLKVSAITNVSSYSEFFPPHALIAEYRGIPLQVEPIGDLTDMVTCTPVSTDNFSSGSPSLTATLLNSSGTNYYHIEITGIVLNGITEQEIIDFINSGSDTCVLHFVGVDAPNYFLFAGIQNFSLSSGTLSFDYFPSSYPDYWQDPNGGFWTTPDGYYWQQPDSTAGGWLPNVISDLVNETHNTLNNIVSSQTWNDYLFVNIEQCCYTTNSDLLYASFELPAMPIETPRNMGVWRVWTDSILQEYIPVQSQQYAMLYKISHTQLSNLLGGMNSYEWNTHKKVIIYKPISQVGTSINVQLLISDPTNMREDDIMPLHEDMVPSVISRVLEILNARGRIDKVNDERDER